MISTTHYEKKEKSGFSLTRKFQKIFRFSKQKNSKNQGKSNLNKKENYESEYQFDAVPDLHQSKSSVDSEEDNLKNLHNGSEEDCSTDHKEKWGPKQPSDAKSERYNQEQGQENYGQYPGSTGQYGVKSETNITVINGTGIQIGHNYYQTNNVNGLHPNVQQHKPMASVEKTPAIKEVLKCQDHITSGHLEFLSQHFGKQWKDIGGKIGITIGELDNIKKQYKNYEERSFQMLNKWCQERGDGVTVGDLCKRLWETKIQAAQEAVHQLTLNKENLD